MRSALVVVAASLSLMNSRLAAADCPPETRFRLFLDAPGSRVDATGERVLDLVVAPGKPLELTVTALLATNPPGQTVTVDLCALFSLFAEHDPETLSVASVENALPGLAFFGGRAVESTEHAGFIAVAPLCFAPVPFELTDRLALVTATYSLVAPHPTAGAEIRTAITLGSFRGHPPIDCQVLFEGEWTTPCLEHLNLHIAVREEAAFLRGDTNFDQKLDISDPVSVLQTLFHGNPLVRCEDAADANDSGALDISDAVFVFAYLFLGGPPPGDPFPAAGADATPDGLSCLAGS